MKSSNRMMRQTSQINWITLRKVASIIAVVMTLAKNSEGTANCPIGFQLLVLDHGSPVCYKLKEPETYGEKYINCHGNRDNLTIWRHLPDYQLSELKIWSDFLRLNEDGILISWSLGDAQMGVPLNQFSLELDKKANNGKYMCTVFNLDSMKLNSVDCNDKYRRFCVVDVYREPSNDEICTGEDYIKFDAPHTTCLKVPLGNNSSSRHAPLRATWTQAVDICRRNEGFLLEKGYVYSNHPAFATEQATQWELPLGITRKDKKSFYWSNFTNGHGDEKIPEAEWNFATEVSFVNSERYVALRDYKWTLVNDSNIFYYVICEHTVSLPKPNIITAYQSNGILGVNVNNTEMTEDQLWCFTDSLLYFPVRVQLTRVEKSNRFIIKPERDGYYWCVSVNTTSHSPQESNRELFVREKSSLERLYAIMLFLDDEYDEEDYTGLETSIMKRLNEFVYYRRMMTQNFGTETTNSSKKGSVKRNRFQTNYEDTIYGLKIKRIYDNHHQLLTHANLGTNVEKLPEGEWKGIRILYMRRTYYCEKNDSLPQMHLGGYHELPHPCTRYKCSGDYNVGVYWEQYNNNEDCEVSSINQTHKTTSITTTLKPIEPELNSESVETSHESEILSEIVPTPEEQVSSTIDNLRDLSHQSTINVGNLITAATQINQILSLFEVDFPTALLRYLDIIVRRVTLDKDDQRATIVQSNLAVVVVENRENHYVGMKLDNLSGNDNLTNNSIELITSDQKSNVTINETTTEIYVQLPKVMSESNDRISFVLFRNDRAFNDNNTEHPQRVNSRILSISIANDTDKSIVFPEDNFVYIHLRPYERNLLANETRQCVYWDFDQGEAGGWSTEGCELIISKESSLDTCRCNHLTHFAEIIGTRDLEIGKSHDTVLSLITFIGCTLSLIGLVLIGLTGILFRTWRREFTNKVWLNLSASIALLIISFFIISSLELETVSPGVCIGVGVLLHYSLLASFSWMLISAILSYQRLVTVFVKNTSHRLLKACIFAWGFPVIFIAPLLISNSNNYADHLVNGTLNYTNKFCYPSGLGYWLSVFLPVVATVVTNTILFICIIYSVFISAKVKRHGDSQEIFRSVTVSFLLFFMFGLTWIFGMLSNIIVFNYLFCITGTVQGFVLFIFFVIGNKKSRELWLEYLRLKEKKKLPVTSTSSRVSGYRRDSCNGRTTTRTLGKFEDSTATKPRSLSGVSDNSRFS